MKKTKSTGRNTGSPPSNFITLLVCAAMLLLLPAAAQVHANPADSAGTPKQRVEQEFQRLEGALNRYIQNDVLKSTNLDQMNQKLHDFMRENPGVARILRVNAGGHSVNDISADSPRSAPSRNISAQAWFKQITQTRRGYYSMDADSTGGSVSLFYAWPLFAGPNRDVFSGAVAALIDFTAAAALIENAPPFQVAYRGKAFFQHDWDEVDYTEEPLEIRGSRDLTIRTMKPIATRLDPIAQTAPPSRRNRAAVSESDGDDKVEEEAASSTGEKTVRGNTAIFGIPVNKALLVLMVLVVALLAYSVLKGRGGKKRFTRDEPAPPEKPTEDVVIVNLADRKNETPAPANAGMEAGMMWPGAMAETVAETEMPAAPLPRKKPTRTQEILAEVSDDIKLDDYILPPQPSFYKASYAAEADAQAQWERNRRGEERRDSDKEQQVIITKMLQLIREDFMIMDKKIQILSQRINDIERYLNN
ncbi:MAG: hypothetical protein FWC23_02665 [Chitinispirillia bacterium]|nr:hypothetical protein [Chitinispirillia bacterium]MCL2268079.1 hypothetical protein [Chitinispirillia bacterium]